MSSPIIWGPLGALNLTNTITTPASTSGALTLALPSTITSYTLTFPNAVGSSGQALVTTNGTGTFGWTTVLSSPLTSKGDLIVADVSANPARLGIGSFPNQVLTNDLSAADFVGWRTPSLDKNYIRNPGFESSTTTFWSLFNTTLTGVLPTGGITTGASSISTFTTTTSSPLGQSASLNVAALITFFTAGDGFITNAFSIDLEDQVKTLNFQFYYQAVAGGGNMNFSGTSSNTLAVYIRDVTNSAWIQPTGVYSMVQSTGVGIASGSFQTTSNSTQYQVAVVCVNTASAPSSMYFDDFYLGPQSTSTAPIVVAAQYTETAGGAYSSGAPINYATKVYDTTNSVTTGSSWVFTAPIPGIYHVTAAFNASANIYTAGQGPQIVLYKNGSALYSLNQVIIQTNFTSTLLFSGSMDVQLIAGDTVYVANGGLAGSPNATGGASLNYISIAKTGN